MLVSVVIPLYNKCRWIERAIASVQKQSHRELELIVVDDGSTDGSAELVRACGDVRVRLCQQENQGVSVARNRGVSEAASDWVAFLDADDWWEPSFLATCLEMRGLHDGVLFGANVWLGDSHRTAVEREGESPWLIDDYCEAAIGREYPPVPNASCLVHKAALLRAGGFTQGVALGEDTDTWLRLSFEGKLVLSREPLVHYEMSDEDSAVRRLCIPVSAQHPPSVATYRRLRSTLPPARSRSFQGYVRWLLRQEIGACAGVQGLKGIARVLRHHGDVAGPAVFLHAGRLLCVQWLQRLRAGLALRTRLQGMSRRFCAKAGPKAEAHELGH